MNLSNVSLVQLQNFSLSFSLLFQWVQLLLVQSYISGSTFFVSLYTNSCISNSFRLLLHNNSVCGYCHIYKYACFLFLFIVIITIIIIIQGDQKSLWTWLLYCHHQVYRGYLIALYSALIHFLSTIFFMALQENFICY